MKVSASRTDETYGRSPMGELLEGKPHEQFLRGGTGNGSILIPRQSFTRQTFFREFKHTLHAQSWHARTPHAFTVEILFFMLLACLTRLAMAESGVTPPRLSFGKALPLVKRVVELAAFLPVDQWNVLYGELLRQLTTCTIDIRPNRFFERDPQKRRIKRRRYFLLQNSVEILRHVA